MAERHDLADDVLDVSGAMELLKLGRNAVYDGCARGVIPHRRIGKLIRFSRTALMQWLGAKIPFSDAPSVATMPGCGRTAVQEAK